MKRNHNNNTSLTYYSLFHSTSSANLHNKAHNSLWIVGFDMEQTINVQEQNKIEIEVELLQG
jgi:hypothetical protein